MESIRPSSSTPPGSSTVPPFEVIYRTFTRFADVAERINATTDRVEKATLMGNYFRTLADDDLLLAVRYLAGYVFPLRDHRTTNVGSSTLLTAVATVTKVESVLLKARLGPLVDLGDVAMEVFPNSVQPTLMLEDVAIAFEQLATTRNSKQRIEWLVRLLEQATPLEAKYLIKLLIGDLRIGLKESIVEDAIARLYEERLGRIQWVNTMLGDIGETALLTRNRQLETARMRLFHPIRFMLASPVTDLDAIAHPMPQGFAVEDKYDGIRAQVHLGANRDDETLHGVVRGTMRVALFSRTLDDMTSSFPDLVEALIQTLASSEEELDGLILDGEIVAIQGTQILPFRELQKRLGRRSLPDSILKMTPVAFVAYDVLYYNQRLLFNKPLRERRAVLDALPFQGLSIQRAPFKRFHDVSGMDAEFLAARARGNEGLMIKDLNSTYKPGRRGTEWLKVKRALATLDVVVTAAEVGHDQPHERLSDYTFAVRVSEADSTLLNVGKANSGLTDAEMAELTEWFRAHTLEEFAHGQVRIVQPKIVLEVTFDRVQVSGQYQSGYALQFPRIVRIRHDKSVEAIDTLETVQQLAMDLGSGDGG